MITGGSGGAEDCKRWERVGKDEGSGAIPWIVCVKTERSSSTENSSSGYLNVVFFFCESVSGALGEQKGYTVILQSYMSNTVPPGK